jgi:hypothetical protein
MALLAFAREVPIRAAVTLDAQTKSGDTKAVVTQVLKQRGTGRAVENLAALVSAVWDYVASLLHRQLTTKAEATRAYVWTFMAVTEVYDVLKVSGEHRKPL